MLQCLVRAPWGPPKAARQVRHTVGLPERVHRSRVRARAGDVPTVLLVSHAGLANQIRSGGLVLQVVGGLAATWKAAPSGV